MKSTSAILMLFLCAFCSSAKGDGKLYANLHVNVQVSDEQGDTFEETRNNNSWLGIKGDHSLVEGVDLVYRFEWKMNVTDERGERFFSERPQFFGVRSRFGTLLLGRNFTALWAAQGKMDLFNHTEGDIKSLFKGENRLPDVLTYVSPVIRDFTFETTLIKGTGNGGESALSAGIYYGDKYLKNTHLFAALAQDFDVKGYDVSRASMQYRFSKNKVGIMLQRQVPASGGDSEWGMMVNYQLDAGKVSWKAQAQYLDDDTGVQLGIDYKLTQNTKVFALLSNYHQDNKEDRRYLGLGIEYHLSLGF